MHSTRGCAICAEADPSDVALNALLAGGFCLKGMVSRYGAQHGSFTSLCSTLSAPLRRMKQGTESTVSALAPPVSPSATMPAHASVRFGATSIWETPIWETP